MHATPRCAQLRCIRALNRPLFRRAHNVRSKHTCQRVWHVQVRYRDGVRVASKGEKYIVESAGPEWNGGSSGKVYTKGKRGKGFV